MTLQDACDILNCGSPYKMRLLLEKRFANQSTSKFDASSPNKRSPIALLDQAIMLGQKQAPACRPPVAMIHTNQPERALAISGGGRRFVEASRQCVRRLADLISGGRSRSGQVASALEPYRDQFNTGFQNRCPKTEPVWRRSDQPLPQPGSSAARRQQFALAANVNHLNQIINPSVAKAGSSPALTTNNTGLQQVVASSNHQSPATSLIGSNQQRGADRGGYSTDEEEEEEDNGEFALDSSLEQFNNRNVNHRLHGPPLFGAAQQLNQVGNGGGGKNEPMDLHLATNELKANPLARKQVSSAAVEASAAATGIGVRRQSAADVVGQVADSAALKRQAKLNQQQHLEQTQSQPEMAIVRNDDDDYDDGNDRTPMSDADNQSLAARSDADFNSADFARSRNPLVAGQAPLAGSVSTPTMNLLSNTGGQTTSANNNNYNNKPNNAGRANVDWQRISSRRNNKLLLKQKAENSSIKEETTSDSSFGADSTSKLVGKASSKQVVVVEELTSSNTNKTNSSEVTSNDSALAATTLADTGQSSLSSKTSTGTHITCLEPRKNLKKANEHQKQQAIKGPSNGRRNP